MNKREHMFSIINFVSVLLFLIVAAHAAKPSGGSGFDENYVVTWGNVLKLNQGKEVQLTMDKAQGSLISTFCYATSPYSNLNSNWILCLYVIVASPVVG